MATLKACLGFQAERCTKLSEHTRCTQHRRKHEAWLHRNRPGPRQRGYDSEYERNRATLRATTEPVCWRCKQPIDLSLPGTHPMGWTADHVVHVSRAGGSALANLRPAHNQCNNSRSDRVEQ